MDNAYLEDPWSSTPNSIEMRKIHHMEASQLEDEKDSLRSTLRRLPYEGKGSSSYQNCQETAFNSKLSMCSFSKIIENIKGHIGTHTRSLRLTLKRHVR
jgi:hypothetical protein